MFDAVTYAAAVNKAKATILPAGGGEGQVLGKDADGNTTWVDNAIAENAIVTSETQPESPATKIWIDEGAEEIELATMADLQVVDDKLTTFIWKTIHRNHPNDLEAIQKLVESGEADKVFKIGDQLNIPWKDTAANIEYTMVFDVVHFGEVETEDGQTRRGMFLQSHYTIPFAVQFGQNQAFYVADNGLSAGTYSFTIGTNWGANCVAGKSYSFNLPTDLPSGGLLQIGLANSEVGACPGQSPANWRVRTYVSQTVQNARDILTLTEGASGTNLGTLTTSSKDDAVGVNNLQRASYGYNRWSKSAVRQCLNSAEDKGAWWTPQHRFDRPPTELFSKDGFLKGFNDDFLSVIKPVKVRTALNTVTDSIYGAWDETYDTFFLASLEEEYCAPQISGEGEVWDYWRERLPIDSPQNIGSANTLTEHIRYALENKSSAQSCRLRSAARDSSTNVYYLYHPGTVSTVNATASIRFAPACVIC